MSVRTTLEHFLQFGQLGPIHLDMSLGEVEALLGKTNSVHESTTILMLKYSAVEIAFPRSKGVTGNLNFIGVYFRRKGALLPSAIRLDGWWPSHGTILDEFQAYASEHGLEMAVQPILTFDTQLGYRVGICTVIFDIDPGGTRIDSIQLLGASE